MSHLVTSTFVSRGRRVIWRHLPAFGVAGAAQVALGSAWSPLVARGAAPLCVASVALGDIHLRFTWQVCHLVTSTFVSHTTSHNFVTHHLSAHHLSPIFSTQLCHTTFFAIPCFTHRFVTHHLSHTTLSHALFHTQLSHTPSFTHNFVTHTIFLCHTPSFTNLSHTTLHIQLVLLLDHPLHPLSFLPSPSPLQHL